MKKLLITACVCAVSVGMAQGAVLNYEAVLDGDQQNPSVLTRAMGTAQISVDTVDETINFLLNVSGISVDDLNDGLVANPVGPIHFHDALRGSNGPIVIPFAFDPATYFDTANGFAVSVMSYSFADAVGISGSSESFSSFVSGLNENGYYINVHTDAFGSGEIRGQISAVPLPASAFLLLAGVGGMFGMRRKSAI